MSKTATHTKINLMTLPAKIEVFVESLPDAEAARRFYLQFSEKFPADGKRLIKNEGLCSDILTLAAFSPLLATTILQNPNYISWLNRQRISSKVRGNEELIESLARFALTNSSVETNVLLARFRRRELLRIYLRDIRNLGTIAEITEEISNLADAILEYALRQARQELDNRFGAPLETDEKSRVRQARFCIVALGKLGSNELNYSSDIDLLFLYSNEGATSGGGSRDAITNREYFVKLAELIIKLVGGQSGEGAAYRVDTRLRPHGRVGTLAITCKEAANYYQTTAQNWERQVLIRSRVSAGDADVFQKFFERVEPSVFSQSETVENALRSVRLSKEKINVQKNSDRNFNVKLGKGGIREIEFIAQALQLAFAGKDKWLRAPHTLISLSRLADRRLVSKKELTRLFEAYGFLRRLEHRLQMENGLQTHIVPNEAARRFLIARRMNFNRSEEFEIALESHVKNVSRIFSRVFGEIEFLTKNHHAEKTSRQETEESKIEFSPIHSPLKKSEIAFDTLDFLSKITPHFAEMLRTNPNLAETLPKVSSDFVERDFQNLLLSAVEKEVDFKSELAVLRKLWSGFLLEIVVFDAAEKISRRTAKRLQTKLAEASLEAALLITRRELERRIQIKIDALSFAVLGLGKLGGGGMDYGSDLDLVLIYDDEKPPPTNNLTHAEFYSRAVEIFVTTLSSLMREGFLYRVDLRLRPDGKNGATSIGKTAFLNYLETRSAIWEWLAYVKLRGVAGDLNLAKETEFEARKIIHENAQRLKLQDSGLTQLSEETKRIRERLETEKSGAKKGKEIDIKFGAGGMLDIYFAVRFLQLRDNVPDDSTDRSTVFMLEKLRANESLSRENFQNFADGYNFLIALDHQLRLTIGRSSKLPLSNQTALRTIVERLKCSSVNDLFEQLTVHRLNVRSSFENIFHVKP